ncbi:MAG: ATP pyrophosphatase [Syntrophus sp. (in: bacteria)]|nr:ATP pyrophosphatase [Syntrophus sp. (in: bacteria)]
MNKIDVSCSWSGGKECAMALYEAQKSGMVVTHLLNMTSEDGSHSRTHGIDASWLKLQSEAIGIPIIQKATSWNGYEKAFKGALREIRQNGGATVIFGDIDLIQHRQWVERVCFEEEITPILPLWQKEREDLLNLFIKRGFRAIIIATDNRYLGEEWLGREVNKSFIEDVKSLNTIDLCGEKGEYHTFVYDGPIFQKPIKFDLGNNILYNNNWLLQINHQYTQEIL